MKPKKENVKVVQKFRGYYLTDAPLRPWVLGETPNKPPLTLVLRQQNERYG